MSEGDKMGLFGSKDENNVSTSKEKDDTDKSKETSTENLAPYNIDSDSETYDTEALSIMDINDIIGVQADTPGESTLESEFAALSEIITDAKDEFVSQDEKSVGIGKIVANFAENETKQEGSNNNYRKKGDSEKNSEDMEKSQQAISTASINKSLQLIGEAYISEDSQESDNDDVDELPVKAPSNLSEIGEAADISEKDVGVTARSESGQIRNTESLDRIAKQIISKNKDICDIEAPRSESAETVLETPRNPAHKESADLTDSVTVEQREGFEDNNDQSMVVDSVASSDMLEKLPAEILSQADESKDLKTEGNAELTSTEEAKEVKQITESVVLAEPMEIDESSEPFAIAKTPPTLEISSNLKTGSEEEKSSCVEAKIILESVKNISESEHEKSPIVDKSKCQRLEPLIEESSDRIPEEIPSETPCPLIGESIIEQNESKDEPAKKSDETSGLRTERGSEDEKNTETSNGVKNIVEPDTPLGEPNNVAEPMEIDDHREENDTNAELVKIIPEKAQDTLSDVETVSDSALKNKTNEENSEETSNVATESPVISQTREKDLLPDSISSKNSNDHSILAESEPCESSSKDVCITSIESAVHTGSEEPSSRLNEDEKMEVDGVPKRKAVEEIEECRAHAEETNEEIAKEMKSSVDTVDDAATISTELQEIDGNVDNDVKNEERLHLEGKNVASPIDESKDIETTGRDNDTLLIEKQEESEIPTTVSPVSINEEAPRNVESAKEAMDEESKQETGTSLSIEKIECSKEIEEIEDANSMVARVEDAREESESLSITEEKDISAEKTEGSDGKNKEIEDEKIIEASSESEEMKVETTLNEEQKIDQISLELAESSTEKESGIVACSEKTESLEVEEMETLLSSVETDFSRDEKNSVSSHKTELLDNRKEEKLSGHEETESSNLEKEESCNLAEEKMSDEEKNPIGPKDNQSSLDKDVETSMSSLKVAEETNTVSSEEDESLTTVGNENSHEKLPAEVESLAKRSGGIEETKLSEQAPEEIVESDEDVKITEPGEKTSVSSEEVESLIDMENENGHEKIPINVESSVDRSEGIEEAKLSEQISEEMDECNEAVKLADPEEKISVSSEEDGSQKKVEHENAHERLPVNVESSSDRFEEAEEAKLSEQVPEEIVGSNEDMKSPEPEEKTLATVPESVNDASETTNKPEADIFSEPKLPSEGSSTNVLPDSSMNSASVDIEVDRVDEQMEVSAQPETFNDDPTISLSDRKYVKQPGENESNGEASVPMKLEEKDEETNLVQLNDCPVQSSAYKSNENDEENQEKNMEDPEDNYASVTQIFQDDEQSQSTQEMMVSILETDKGNINKILDDQEADDLETSAMDNVAKSPNESEDMLDKALEDPMTGQNIDSLEGLLDLDLMPENDEPNLKSVEPIVDKVIQESCDDIETIGKNVDVSLLMEENDTIENSARSDNYNPEITTKIMDNPTDESNASSVDDLVSKTNIEDNPELEESPDLTDKDLEAFDLASVVTNPLEIVDPSEEAKLDLADDLLQNIAGDEERKIELTEKLLLDDNIQEQDLLLSPSIQQPTKIDIPDEVFLPVEAEREMELAEDISLDSAVRDQVLNEVAAEMENLPQNSEISELESAVKFLQESEEQDIDLPLVLSPKMVEGVVDDIVEHSNVDLFSTEPDICPDPSELVAELESIIPDPIAISEAEIINEAAKLETERKTKLFQEAKTSNTTSENAFVEEIVEAKSPLAESSSKSSTVIEKSEDCENIEEPQQEIVAREPEVEKIEHEELKKSVPIPKISILEERLKIPPKIEIPVGDVSRMCELPTTPKTSLLIQRDARTINLMKQLESPKSADKSELKIVDTPRKDNEKYDFENVGSPRIILKIAKSAIADCSEPRSPKSPKIRSAANSPNPEDSPGQKLGKIKLKLSKGGHPSIISNDNVEEHCGQWHTEGSSSLSPLGMKIKFSKISDITSAQADKYEGEDTREQTPKHKFEEAKRTESPLGMKIKLSKTGEPSIVQQDAKETAAKHREKIDVAQHDSPKRTESSIGMKIKFSKSGDASIVLPEKQETTDEHKDAMQQHTDKADAPRRTESPLGMKFKLFKTGDASIVQTETQEDNQQEAKRTDSPVSKKIKLSKARGSTPILASELSEDAREKLELSEEPKRTDSPLGMKIKLSKRGDASIIHSDEPREAIKQRPEMVQESTHIAEGTSVLKTKIGKSPAIVQPEVLPDNEAAAGITKRADPMIGMKIKLSKSGDASIVHPERDENSEETRNKEKPDSVQENIRKVDASIGMKIKLSKSGDASIIQSAKKSDDQSSTLESREAENSRTNETSSTAKTKLQKSIEPRRKETESPLEMKIKLSKTGHPTIVACDNYTETSQRSRETIETSSGTSKQSLSPRDNAGMKILKGMQGANRSELTIEPIQLQSRKSEMVEETSPKRKDITISPIESKKSKLEAKLSHILPEVTIQPITPRDQKQQIMFEAKAGSISRQQMNVISQEISITQVRSNKPMDLVMTDKLKSILTKNPTAPSNDCEIIEHRPELIIVNENSNSSQDVMIIEEVPVLRSPENKVPKKRGRPRRNPLPIILAKPAATSVAPTEPNVQTDPLALDNIAKLASLMTPQVFPPIDNEASGRPKRTCRNQKSYAPPRRGRGGRGGRGKRKMEMNMDLQKRPRIEQDLDMIERSTTALISIHEPPSAPARDIVEQGSSCNTSELYKALRQPTMDRKLPNAIARNEIEQAVNDSRANPDVITKSQLESYMDARIMSHLDGVISKTMANKAIPYEGTHEKDRKLLLVDISSSDRQTAVDLTPEESRKSDASAIDHKIIDKIVDEVKDNKDSSSTMDHENWLTPSSRKQFDGRNEGNISNVQVMDEETRMSAESGSRSQTPAKNMSVQASETIVNEESQGSVLSTATTESEKVKVKTRRMEINFDPDEGPFTVDKIAEYDWPQDPMKKNETFMIQEQISHYLGVKSFKRKYPDLKRRMVDMEERNYLRENALVSEAMCDMGLTAVLSSEVLDVMCSDFPDQYEEYRKHIREKQMKEHFKKQKELTAAANAEKNRIDLAEMAVQSALSWNVGLNKARRESRKCSLDLQTFTIHVPKKQQKVEENSNSNHYPVALIPGQYTDYYREYTPAELRYYPLNTVLYGPMRPNERKFDSQSEGSQSDSDSDSSSDDSSSSSSEGTQDTEASQSTMDDVDAELSRQKDDIKSTKCKMCLKHLNKFNRAEVLIQCGTCNGYVHPSCIDLTLDMVPHIQAYAWQCTDCKTCAQCHDPADEDKMLFCDMCDRGYHIYCVGLRRVPQGRWHCQECAVCASCGSREAGGTNSDRNSVAQWQHEYKKGDKNTRVYVSTLCVPCSKLWRKGRYCPHCSRCHTVQRLDLEVNLVHCSACDKYLHLGCVESKDLTIDRKNYRCEFCQSLRNHMVKPLVSKVFRT